MNLIPMLSCGPPPISAASRVAGAEGDRTTQEISGPPNKTAHMQPSSDFTCAASSMVNLPWLGLCCRRRGTPEAVRWPQVSGDLGIP